MTAAREQYRAITGALAPLLGPYRIIPSNHDFAPRHLRKYRAAFPQADRPEIDVIAGHRRIVLVIVSPGTRLGPTENGKRR